jgi:hypothetical protein
LLVLKFKNLTRDWDGYLVVYHAPDGSYFYTTNGENNPWKPFPTGEPVDIPWDEGSHARVHIEIVRPNANADEKDREVDYRFWIETLPDRSR